jgi:hypothetical protein
MRYCQGCDDRMENVSLDSTKVDWVCKNNRCLESLRYRDVRCPVCETRPAELVDCGCSFDSLQCRNGHLCAKHAGGTRTVG